MAGAGAALTLPQSLGWTPLSAESTVRIRGRVRAEGTGLEGVPVTDGRRIVDTAADGSFELSSSTRQLFVYLSVPAGYRIPTRPTGTAQFYRPIVPDDDGEMKVHFDLEPLPQPDDQHAFLLLADPQTQTEADMEQFRSKVVPAVSETAAALGSQPVFGVTCGDITFDSPELYPQYEAAVQEMGVPFLQVVGNHDMDYGASSDDGSTETYRNQFGPTYYSFDRGAVHYVVLDDVFWNQHEYFGYVNDAQLAWLAGDLERVESGRPVVVFQHIPAYSTLSIREGEDRPEITEMVTNRSALYELLAPYDAHICSGHTHEHEHVLREGVHEHIHGAACGAWWTADICFDGTPRGFGVYEVNGTNLQWRYQSAGHEADHQMRVYGRGADSTAPDEFVANVWDSDPEWTVTWSENGVQRGRMARRVGRDPRAVELFEGDKPERFTWIRPGRTGHLFYAPVAPDHGRLRVEATDQFGRTYSAPLRNSAPENSSGR
ncbi:calcineurin-like phosphoesterase family protein [Salinibacter ruber]|uniref:calcineurin-like phosphoesterase family protein n=1 Tax=Salinibacter ruber TaxID=146919 RepID=UPI002166E8E6|nr:calcineurin-like phosphoesterase family protein [Salinibacter ruber]